MGSECNCRTCCKGVSQKLYESMKMQFETPEAIAKREKELAWHKFYLNIAKQYSQWSKDQRTKVGCIIVPSDFSKILSVGYNGWERGGPDLPDSTEPGQSGAVHAEINCCIKFSEKAYDNCYMYITHSPCAVCARVIVNLGCIKKVFYIDQYRILKGVEILIKSGISCQKIELDNATP